MRETLIKKVKTIPKTKSNILKVRGGGGERQKRGCGGVIEKEDPVLREVKGGTHRRCGYFLKVAFGLFFYFENQWT